MMGFLCSLFPKHDGFLSVLFPKRDVVSLFFFLNMGFLCFLNRMGFLCSLFPSGNIFSQILSHVLQFGHIMKS